MSIFDQREKAAELEFVRSQERLFRQRAKRNRLLAKWAAGLLGQPVDAYLDEVIDTDYREGETGVLSKLTRDFTTAGVALAEGLIQTKLDNFTRQAAEVE